MSTATRRLFQAKNKSEREKDIFRMNKNKYYSILAHPYDSEMKITRVALVHKNHYRMFILFVVEHEQLTHHSNLFRIVQFNE